MIQVHTIKGTIKGPGKAQKCYHGSYPSSSGLVLTNTKYYIFFAQLCCVSPMKIRVWILFSKIVRKLPGFYLFSSFCLMEYWCLESHGLFHICSRKNRYNVQILIQRHPDSADSSACLVHQFQVIQQYCREIRVLIIQRKVI